MSGASTITLSTSPDARWLLSSPRKDKLCRELAEISYSDGFALSNAPESDRWFDSGHAPPRNGSIRFACGATSQRAPEPGIPEPGVPEPGVQGPSFPRSPRPSPSRSAVGYTRQNRPLDEPNAASARMCHVTRGRSTRKPRDHWRRASAAPLVAMIALIDGAARRVWTFVGHPAEPKAQNSAPNVR